MSILKINYMLWKVLYQGAVPDIEIYEFWIINNKNFTEMFLVITENSLKTSSKIYRFDTSIVFFKLNFTSRVTIDKKYYSVQWNTLKMYMRSKI